MAAIVHLEHGLPGSVRPAAGTDHPQKAAGAGFGRAHDGVVLGLLAVILLLAVSIRVAGSASAPATAAVATRAPAPVHVVEQGDTYWSIAAGLHLGGDVRATVDHLVEVNGRRTLQPGDRVVLAPPGR